MEFIRKFFEDGAANNAGGDAGAAAVVDTKKQADTIVADPPKDLPQPVFTLEELKTLGLDSKEAAIAFINKAKEDNRPEEEKQKKANIEKANFLKYAAERDFLTDDFKKYESLEAKADRDLVFEKYAAEEKADNPALTDEEIKEAFESEYKLNNENEKIKAKGEAKLKREANELRKPSQNAWNKAQESYKGELGAWQKHQEFKGLVKDTFKSEIPEKYSVKVKIGEEEIPVIVDVTPELKTKIEKAFNSEKTLSKYLSFDGKPADFAADLSRNIKSFIKSELADLAIEEGVKIGIKRGTAKASKGADNPFALQDNTANNQQTRVATVEESTNKIANARKQYARR